MWTTDKEIPLIFFLAHEDSSGKIYGSDYFLLVHKDYKNTQIETDAVNNLQADYLTPMCNSLIALASVSLSLTRDYN